jgi:hypothetical protein
VLVLLPPVGCAWRGAVGFLVCALWGLLCPSLLWLPSFPLCLLLVLCPLLRVLLLLPVLLLLVLASLPRLLWLVVLCRLLPLFPLSRVLCLLSLPLTLVVWCVLLVVARSVACGPLLVVRPLLLPLPWCRLSVLLVVLVSRLTCGVLLVAPVCLAPVTSALCLPVDRSSSVASACAGSSVVVCLVLPVGAFALSLWRLLCLLVVVVLGWLLLVCACCVLTLLVTLLMVALRSRLNSLLFPSERPLMFRLFVTGLLFVAALLSVAVASAYSLWPLFLVSCLCMLCAYCAFTFED